MWIGVREKEKPLHYPPPKEMMSASYREEKRNRRKEKVSVFSNILRDQIFSILEVLGRFPGGIVIGITSPFDEVLVLAVVVSSVENFFDFILLLSRARDLDQWWW